MPRRPPSLVSLLLVLLIISYTAFFSAQLFQHYDSFGSRALDLGNMDQSIWNSLHGRPFHQTNQPGATSRLSLHVEPILLPLSLLYLVYSGPKTLFVVQSLVVALGALPVFALARRRLASNGLALVFALVYLMFPAIQGATLLDFHAVTLAPTFLLAAFYFLEVRRSWLFGLFAGLAVACKEDMALLVLMMGLYALLAGESLPRNSSGASGRSPLPPGQFLKIWDALARGQRRLGLATIAACLGWAVLAVFVIPPLLAGTGNIHWNRYDHLGDSPLAIVANFFLQPGLVLDHLRQVQALNYLRLLLAPTAYLALLSPATLLLALPSLAINLLSNFPPMQEVNALIYAAPIVPAVMISSIYGAARLQRAGELAARRIRQGLLPRSFQLSLHAASFTPLFRSDLPERPDRRAAAPLNFLLGGLLLAATVVYHASYGYLPGGGQFRGWEEVTAHHSRAAQILAQIPPEAALSAQDRLNPHASQRQTLYIFDRIEDADYIVLDVSEDSWPLHPVELRNRVDRFLAEGWGVVDGLDGYLLLARRPGLNRELPDAFFDFARVAEPETFRPRFATPATFGDGLQLLGYDLALGAHEEKLPVITLYWRALRPLAKDYRLWPFVIDRQGRLVEDTAERPLVATLWYPTSRWRPGETIQTRTLPRDLGDEFTVAVGVADGEWTDPGRRLPVTDAGGDRPAYEGRTWLRLGTFRRTGRATYEAVAAPIQPPTRPRRAEFWHLINLQGVDLPDGPLRPGSALPFTLYWQSAAPLTVDLTTFVHLLAADGRTAAQLDWTPQDALGFRPTTTWLPGQPVVDSQVLPLPADLPPGQYRLIAGWYYSVTGDRLPLTVSDAGPPGGDVIELGTVTIR